MYRLLPQNDPSFDPFKVDALGEGEDENIDVSKGGRVGNRGLQTDQQEKLDAKKATFNWATHYLINY